MAAAEAKAYVYADPDGLSNGLWFWTGSAWAKDGLDVAGRLRGLADATNASGTGPVARTQTCCTGGSFSRLT